jgi:DNA-binding CsgD family transcriptional regulator
MSRDSSAAKKQNCLRERFGLTPAQAHIALALLDGGGRRDIAARLGISEATVRAHLSQVFEKTDVHRQAELVRLLMRVFFQI